MIFAIYARKSTYSDKSDSISNQISMCKDYIAIRHGKGHEFREYADEGFTGANIDRPSLKNMLEDIKEGLINSVVIYQLDRLSRNVKDFSNIYALLDSKGISFVSVKESVDTDTPIGRAMVMITMVFAQMERETIAERVADNLSGLAKKGFWTGGNPPYGYRKVSIEIGGKRHYTMEVVPDAAKEVERVFDDFLDGGYSINSLQTAYKKKGKRTPGGAFFSSGQIYALLSMPYCCPASPEVWDYYNEKGCQIVQGRDEWDGKNGVMVYGRTTENRKKKHNAPPEQWIVSKGMHKPFMSADKWIAAQNKFSQGTFIKKSKYPPLLLKGVLRCGNCGCLMAVNRSRGSIAYFCPKRKKEGKESCFVGYINSKILDEKVVDIFKKIGADPDAIKDYSNAKKPQDSGDAIKALEKKASNIQEKLDRLTESLAFAQNSTASKYIVAQIEKEDRCLAEISKEINSAKRQRQKSKIDEKTTKEKAEIISSMIRNLSELDAYEKNSVVRKVVKECTWDGETLKITL